MPKAFEAIDIGLSNATEPGELSALAKASERYGFRTLWVSEDYHERSAVALATFLASQTKHIRIGWGIISSLTRHPAVIAMEAATIDEISGGRMIIGIGPVVQSMRKHTIRDAKPVRATKEAVEIIRKMQGSTFTYDGRDFPIPPPGISLKFKPVQKRIPIYVGAMAPQMFRAAGRLGDGVFLSYYASPAFVKYGIELAKASRKKAGLKTDLDTVTYIRVFISRDRDLARNEARKFLYNYLQVVPAESPRFLYAGFKKGEFRSLIEEIRASKSKGLTGKGQVTDDIIDRLVVAGSPEDCIKGLKKYLDSGLKVPAPYGIGPDQKEGLRLLGESVIPYLM